MTKTETEIMDLLWAAGHKMSFKELLEYFNETMQKGWKKQTLSTYLLNLQKAGLIGAETAGKNYYYFAACTKEEHIHNWTKELLAESFGCSLAKFVSAFSGGEKLSKEDSEELKQFLDE